MPGFFVIVSFFITIFATVKIFFYSEKRKEIIY